jgi:hypothetical protein
VSNGENSLDDNLELEDNYFDIYADEINSILEDKEVDNMIARLNETGFDYKFSNSKTSLEPLILIDVLSYFSHLNSSHKLELENEKKNSVNLDQHKIEKFLLMIRKLNSVASKVLDCYYFTDLNESKRPRISLLSQFDVSLHEINNEKDELIGYTPYVDFSIKFSLGSDSKQEYVSLPYDSFKSLLNFLNTIDNDKFKKSINRYKGKINNILWMED